MEKWTVKRRDKGYAKIVCDDHSEAIKVVYAMDGESYNPKLERRVQLVLAAPKMFEIIKDMHNSFVSWGGNELPYSAAIENIVNRVDGDPKLKQYIKQIEKLGYDVKLEKRDG